jgi:predicted PurR-regulated permease PerM
LLQRLRFLEAPFAALQHFWQQIENFAGWETGTNSSGSAFLTTLLTGTRSLASGFFTTLLFLFFLLVAGEIFLQRLIEIMPRFGSKRQVVDIANQIESEISAYLLTITAMNAAVGIATAAVMWLTGVGDPALWDAKLPANSFRPVSGANKLDAPQMVKRATFQVLCGRPKWNYPPCRPPAATPLG